MRLAIANDDLVRCKYVDIARKGFQDARNTLYVQCHQKHKETLTAWVKQYILTLQLPDDQPNPPRVDDGYQTQQDQSNRSSKKSETHTVNTNPLTKFHYMHDDDSFRATNLEAGGSKGRSRRSSSGWRSKGSNSIPTHVDLDVSSWADVVKRRASKHGEIDTRYGDNNSQQSHGSDKSTIPSVKSHREQELETMVDRLNKENINLKQAQEATLQTQQKLMKTNQDLIAQVQTMQTQLATVKEDIRKEFDQKFEQILDLFRDQSFSNTTFPTTKIPRDESPGDSGDSPARKKPDNKTTPTHNRYPAMSDDRHLLEQMHMRNWLMYRYNAPTGYSNTMNPQGLPYMMPPGTMLPPGTMNLPQARADQMQDVG